MSSITLYNARLMAVDDALWDRYISAAEDRHKATLECCFPSSHWERKRKVYISWVKGAGTFARRFIYVHTSGDYSRRTQDIIITAYKEAMEIEEKMETEKNYLLRGMSDVPEHVESSKRDGHCSAESRKDGQGGNDTIAASTSSAIPLGKPAHIPSTTNHTKCLPTDIQPARNCGNSNSKTPFHDFLRRTWIQFKPEILRSGLRKQRQPLKPLRQEFLRDWDAGEAEKETKLEIQREKERTRAWDTEEDDEYTEYDDDDDWNANSQPWITRSRSTSELNSMLFS